MLGTSTRRRKLLPKARRRNDGPKWLCTQTPNLTTDSTDNTDLHGSKKFNRAILIEIRVIRSEICFLCKPTQIQNS
jgi:hypothetical protein